MVLSICALRVELKKDASEFSSDSLIRVSIKLVISKAS